MRVVVKLTLETYIKSKLIMSVVKTRRLLREQREPKIPQESGLCFLRKCPWKAECFDGAVMERLHLNSFVQPLSRLIDS